MIDELLQRMGITGMKTSQEERKEMEGGARERLDMSLLNRGGRFSCLQAIPVNIDVDVRSTLLRISYKARGLDLLCANCKHLKSHATPAWPSPSVLKGGNGKRHRGLKSCSHTREVNSLSRFTARSLPSLSLSRWFRFPLSS